MCRKPTWDSLYSAISNQKPRPPSCFAASENEQLTASILRSKDVQQVDDKHGLRLCRVAIELRCD
eukprot:COSAG04_NODE_31005_length_259_cov_0.650000_2_plen_64_part_01